jgi:hypothetical protein
MVVTASTMDQIATCWSDGNEEDGIGSVEEEPGETVVAVEVNVDAGGVAEEMT